MQLLLRNKPWQVRCCGIRAGVRRVGNSLPRAARHSLPTARRRPRDEGGHAACAKRRLSTCCARLRAVADLN